jgi:uncharacterized protein (TIGR03067 family)
MRARAVPVLGLVLALLAAAGARAEKAESLVGTWAITTAERNGKDAPEIAKHRIVFARDTFRIFLGDKVVYAGTYTVDTSKKPAAIDFNNTEGKDKGQKWLGIWKLDKGRLTICDNGADTANKPRPKEFQTAKDSGYVLVTCTREKQ